ncbi:hypothetical protein ABT160_44075 [Streptomyces sp. NPDC001941]|uniref:hypothetical protein n=1 Tax=Streptomyces sp. NPDC001941 TaxID=3154659 RepID=UPI003316ED7C
MGHERFDSTGSERAAQDRQDLAPQEEQSRSARRPGEENERTRPDQERPEERQAPQDDGQAEWS